MLALPKTGVEVHTIIIQLSNIFARIIRVNRFYSFPDITLAREFMEVGLSISRVSVLFLKSHGAESLRCTFIENIPNFVMQTHAFC